jgi:hypothetical protein
MYDRLAELMVDVIDKSATQNQPYHPKDDRGKGHGCAQPVAKYVAYGKFQHDMAKEGTLGYRL